MREQAAPGTPLLTALLDEADTSTPQVPEAPLRPLDTIVAECLDAGHPSLMGRVLVRWSGMVGGTISVWVPTLHGLPVRSGDRVLVMQPLNAPEPIVLGVVDGFAARPEPKHETAARIELRRDEAIRITGSDGAPLVELFQADSGPVVRLLAPDANLDLPGDLRVSARSIALIAREGEMSLKARDDVVVEGETINLNN